MTGTSLAAMSTIHLVRTILLRWHGALTSLLTLSVLIALAIGKFPISVAEILHFLAASVGWAEMAQPRYDALYNVLVDIRLPRILTAILVGMALATSGAAFQAVFRNPLVSPGLLGVLGGAAFGAALGILLDGSWLLIQALSFLMGLAAVTFGVCIANIFGTATMITLVLGGMISSALFAALLSMVKYLADPLNQLPSIVYWLMGSLAQTTLPQLAWLAPPMATLAVLLILSGKALDAMSMGDDEARSLGIPVTFLRYAIIAAATFLSALTVSMAGMIGWVGLIIPHVARLMLGPANTRLLPATALLGASFLVGADCVARTATEMEIPIGIVTELLGIPVFLLVLHRSRKGWV